MATTTSKLFTLNVSDFVKGLLMAVLVPVIAIISDSLSKGTLVFDWKLIGITALSGFLGYLVKNFLTPSATVIPNPPASK